MFRRDCEDDAIQNGIAALDCFASLAMTMFNLMPVLQSGQSPQSGVDLFQCRGAGAQLLL
jgi:hypothetical protein